MALDVDMLVVRGVPRETAIALIELARIDTNVEELLELWWEETDLREREELFDELEEAIDQWD